MSSRANIRAAIVALLMPLQVGNVARVYKQRVKPLSDSLLPFISVDTDNESAERLHDGYTERRRLTVLVRIFAQDAAAVADDLDGISDQVESLLAASPKLSNTVEHFDYKGANPDYGSAAQVEAASLVLEFECVYLWTYEPDSDDFETLAVQIDMSGPRNDPQDPTTPDGQIDAAATIALPQ